MQKEKEKKQKIRSKRFSTEQINEMFAEVEPPELMYEMDLLLQVFFDVGRSRQEGMGGPQHISYQELKAYQELTGIQLAPTEIEILRAIDSAFVGAVNTASKESRNV